MLVILLSLLTLTIMIIFIIIIIKLLNDYEYVLPKKIFAYYHDLPTNKVIQAHKENWMRKIPDWEIIFLDQTTVVEYLDAEGINYLNSLKPIQFSDYLRFYLLKKYGGLWMDAGIIVFDGKFINSHYNEMKKNKYDVCVYEYKIHTTHPKLPHYENWFLMAPKNSVYISDVYHQYIKAIQMGFINYKRKILIPSGVNLNKTVGYGNNTYLIQHAIINYLMHLGKKYHINHKIAEISMLNYTETIGWKYNEIVKHIIENKNWDKIYAYKLTTGTRNAITHDLVNKYIDKINII